MSATEATAEIFVTAFKSLKRREREALFERLLTDKALSEDLADTLALEACRHQAAQVNQLIGEGLKGKPRAGSAARLREIAATARK